MCRPTYACGPASAAVAARAALDVDDLAEPAGSIVLHLLTTFGRRLLRLRCGSSGGLDDRWRTHRPVQPL